MLRRVLIGVGLVSLALVVVVYLLGRGWLGEHEGPAAITEQPRTASAVRAREIRQAGGAARAPNSKQILFGDLHVHTTISFDAFARSLPMMQGEGPHPQSDACDFARFCSALDFWSINDHAESITPRAWRETIEAIRRCNAVADERHPDTVAFLGWEWTQVGETADEHYGHRNVILAGTEDDEIPARPIADGAIVAQTHAAVPGVWSRGAIALVAGGRFHEFARYFTEVTDLERCPSGVRVRDLPPDCQETADTPAELLEKLDDWGYESIVIPHGTAWGFYTPPGTSWDKQLTAEMHDPRRQILLEVYSGHGSSEEYRDWRGIEIAKDGSVRCPPAHPDYLPRCRRAGEIILARCRKEGRAEAECEARAARARQLAAEAGLRAHLTVPGYDPYEWLDAGQCRDCTEPPFNHRPGGSAQYALALSKPVPDGDPLRFRFGLIASSDNHFARAGTGYKEVRRLGFTESADRGDPNHVLARLMRPPAEEPASEPRPFDPADPRFGAGQRSEMERQASFYMTGGLVAVHASGRDRNAIWQALTRREAYGTSGPRILLWFDLLGGEDEASRTPMGSAVTRADIPTFEVRAVGSFEQKPGCPEDVTGALSPAEVERLCKGECYHPSDRRRPITRIEVVRIRPQAYEGEPVAGLIEDPWRVFACEPDPDGCVVRFDDPQFPIAARDAVYYVRAIEAPKEVINAGGLRCSRDDQGRCASITLCGQGDAQGDCLAVSEPRAWSSPIFVDWSAHAPAISEDDSASLRSRGRSVARSAGPG